MFQSGKESEIESMTCPFDGAHLMPKSSFIRHIDRCKSLNKNQFKQCPYDVYHIVKKLSFDAHVKNCPSRKDYQKEIPESDWDSSEDFCDNFSDQNYRQKDANDWQYEQILTESIARNNNIDFSAELNQSQLAKALFHLHINQESDNSGAEEWIMIPDGRKGMSSLGSFSLSQQSSSNRNKKLQERIYSAEIESSDQQKASKKASNNPIYPTKFVKNPKEEINFKPSVYNTSFSVQVNSPLLKTNHHQLMIRRPYKEQHATNFSHDSSLFRPNSFDKPEYRYFGHSAPRFYGQSYNNMIPSKYTNYSWACQQTWNPILNHQIHLHHYYHPAIEIDAQFRESDEGFHERKEKIKQKEIKHRKDRKDQKRGQNQLKEKVKKEKKKKQ